MSAPPAAPEQDLTATQETQASLPPASGFGRHLVVSIAAASALIGFVFSAGVSVLAPPAHTNAEPRAAGSVVTPPAEPPAPRERELGACRRTLGPVRVNAAVSPTLPLEASARATGESVLIGAATSAGAPLGLSLDSTTLDARTLLEESPSRDLLGVVPAAASAGGPRFVIDRASGVGRERRTLPDHPELVLARTERGLEFWSELAAPVPLWPLEPDVELSRARIEWQSERRLALVLRRGGRRGQIALGWLDTRTGQRSPLRDIQLGAHEVGLPSLAVHGRRAAVTAAVRSAPNAPWRVELATGEWLAGATVARLPELTTDPTADTFAPSLGSLDGARWFLQWTEGREGQRRVKGLTLSEDFTALGEPIVLSSPDTSAGGGTLVPVDGGFISLFLVQRPARYELWAAALGCG